MAVKLSPNFQPSTIFNENLVAIYV